jgi:hypothetical protein
VILSSIFILISITGCSTRSQRAPLSPVTTENGFSKAREVEGELIVKISDIKVFKGVQLKENNLDQGIPEDQEPTLLVWSADPIDQPTQRDFLRISYDPEPTAIFTDPDHQNRICFWDLSNLLTDDTPIQIKRRFIYTAFDWQVPLPDQPASSHTEKIPSKIRELYTRDEPYLEQTEEIKSAAEKAIGQETDPIKQANLLFQYVRHHMTYKYPPKQRGAQFALKSAEGDCGQYSYLFIALCRAVGIPARLQAGFHFIPDKTGYHVWSEIYTLSHNWIPVDTSYEDQFAHLDNERLITSVGMNIPLKYAPSWATFENSDVENGHTDFMQMVTMVRSGFICEVSTERHVIRSTVFP